MDNQKTKSFILPNIKKYNQEQQVLLANELNNNNIPMCRIFVVDYHKMQQETYIAKKQIEG